MIAHVRDECAWRVLFFSDIIYSGHYLGSVSMASAVRNCRCPWKLESYVSCVFLDLTEGSQHGGNVITNTDPCMYVMEVGFFYM